MTPTQLVRRILVFVILAAPLGSSRSQTLPFCSTSDSLMSSVSGLDALLHPFGADTVAYPNEFDLPSNFLPFSQVFEL
jgi:hypothetical protein